MDDEPLISTPQCASYGCTHGGYVKSEQWNARLCPVHALTGPVRLSEKGVPVLDVNALDQHAEQQRYSRAVNKWVAEG